MIDFSHATSAAATDVGRVRKNNEDAFLLLPEDGLFAVADGMGGASAGEVASRMVVETLEDYLRGSAEESPGERKCGLLGALREANKRVRKHAAHHGFKSMGSTAVCLLLDPWDPGRALFCHAGDSRAYCYRGAELFQITRDHTLGEAQRRIGLRPVKDGMKIPSGVLMRAIGTHDRLDPEWTAAAVCPGDLFILCSDGLTGMLPEEEWFKSGGSVPLPSDTHQITQSLVRAALEKGGRDNVTVVAVQIANPLPPPREVDELDRKESDHLLEVAERKN